MHLCWQSNFEACGVVAHCTRSLVALLLVVSFFPFSASSNEGPGKHQVHWVLLELTRHERCWRNFTEAVLVHEGCHVNWHEACTSCLHKLCIHCWHLPNTLNTNKLPTLHTQSKQQRNIPISYSPTVKPSNRYSLYTKIHSKLAAACSDGTALL